MHPWSLTGLTVWALIPVVPARAQDGGGGLGGPGVIELLSTAEGRLVAEVDVRLRGTTGDPERDTILLDQARTLVGLRAGDRLTTEALTLMSSRVEKLEGVVEARTHLVSIEGGGVRTRVIVEVLLVGAGEELSKSDPDGSAKDGAASFPDLWRSERGRLKFILGGGVGGFTDGNPWFGNASTFTAGNPLVEDPAVGANTGSRATWAETWLEFGLGGVSQLGDSNMALYGAVTGIGVAARGQDIFRGDPRESLDLEKAYAGLLWGSDDLRRSANLAAGRLNFSLNDGFLISQFGSQYNAGPRPGIYLAPRTTHDFAATGTFKFDDWSTTAFLLDPNEYEPLESNTKLAGLNLRYNFSERLYADVTYIDAVESETSYGTPSGPIGTREGLRTYAAHARWSAPKESPGVWLESELAHQQHDEFDMRAWAGYGTLGYIARESTWTPSLSYRFSAFTGDDPATESYERFDSLFSGGLSQWLQGISLGKVVRPENRLSHRLRFNVAPSERLNLTLDGFLHTADELNNIGANPAIADLSSSDLGQELQLVARWAISNNLYFVGVAAVAFPGDALESASGGDADEWTTLQAQLFWSI